ncbi:MAG: Crp/Fnr family transcriptional regulator [Prevotella sp.]|nr:Crp/Fnr family transcriptional regulator [Prevotella sp.]
MHHELQLYDHLLQFSLFQGLSHTELLQLAGNTKFGFRKVAAGKTVVKEGEVCQTLFFLISGQLTLVTQSDDRHYRVEERLSAPWLLQPEVLFGAQPRFGSTVTTATESHFITLSKDEVLRLSDDFLIFRLNLLNLLSTQSQRRGHLGWRRTPTELRQRIVRFLLDHCLYPAGPKMVYILMEQLALELNDSRLDVSRALNAMQADGLLLLHRGRIEIPSLERLLM